MNLELEKKRLEYKKVEVAKDEMEYKVLEREMDILRIKENIKIQESRMFEIKEEIKQLQGE